MSPWGGIRHSLNSFRPLGHSRRGEDNGYNHISAETGYSEKGTLPHHLLPKSVRRDIDNIRRRVKTLRHLASLAARHLENITFDTSLLNAMWSQVNTPVPIRTDHSPPTKDLASLVILNREDLATDDDTSPS